MSASAWATDLRAAITHYQRTRRTTPVVRVTLVTGESRYVLSVSAGAEDMLVSLDLYPEDDVSDLLEIEGLDDRGEREVDRVTREVLVLPPSAVRKVDLLHQHPDQRPGRARFGFQGAEEPA